MRSDSVPLEDAVRALQPQVNAMTVQNAAFEAETTLSVESRTLSNKSTSTGQRLSQAVFHVTARHDHQRVPHSFRHQPTTSTRPEIRHRAQRLANKAHARHSIQQRSATCLSLSRKIDRTRGILERDGGKSVTDFAYRNEVHQAAQHCLPRWDQVLCTMSMQVVWMGVSQTKLH